VVFTLFNGSYIGKRNTGIGSVAKNLVSSFSTDLVTLLDPLNSGRIGSIQIPSDLSPDNGLRGHLKRLYWVQKEMPRLVKNKNAQFLLSPLPEAPLVSPVRSIVLAHDLLPLRYPKPNLLLAYYGIYIPAVLYEAKLILCNSEATACELHNYLKVPLKKLVTIKLGFDSDKFYPKYLNREEFFLVLGRHNPHKNLKRVLKAFSLLNIKNYKMVFIGPFDQRYTPTLKHLAKELNIDDKCIWKDWVSDYERLMFLNKCRALIMPSLWEGFGLPALEALACGTTVITSNRGGLPEVVGDAAFLIDPLRYESMASAMMEVSRNESILKKSQIDGPKQALNFSWLSTAKQIENILLQL